MKTALKLKIRRINLSGSLVFIKKIIISIYNICNKDNNKKEKEFNKSITIHITNKIIKDKNSKTRPITLTTKYYYLQRQTLLGVMVSCINSVM